MESAGPQHGPVEPRPPYGVLESGGMVAGADAVRGQQHDPPDPTGPDNVEDVVEVAALRHEVAGGQKEERLRAVEGGLEGPGCGEVGPMVPHPCRDVVRTPPGDGRHPLPAARSALTSGRPTFPVAPVTTIMLLPNPEASVDTGEATIGKPVGT